MEHRILQAITNGLTVAAIGGLAAAIVLTYGPRVKDTLVRGHGEVNQTECMIAQVYEIAAGEDRILDMQEKGKLMQELNIPGALDESERITIGNASASSAVVYAEAGYHQWRRLGNVSRADLEAYITKHVQEKGK